MELGLLHVALEELEDEVADVHVLLHLAVEDILLAPELKFDGVELRFLASLHTLRGLLLWLRHDNLGNSFVHLSFRLCTDRDIDSVLFLPKSGNRAHLGSMPQDQIDLGRIAKVS